MSPSLAERLEGALSRIVRPALARLLRLLSYNVLAKAISLAAAASLFVLLRVNTLDQRFFSVPLQFELPPGYALASVAPQSARLTLRGEQELIFSLSEEEFTAVVDLRPFPAEGEHEAPVEVLTEGRAANVQRLEVASDPTRSPWCWSKPPARALGCDRSSLAIPLAGTSSPPSPSFPLRWKSKVRGRRWTASM